MVNILNVFGWDRWNTWGMLLHKWGHPLETLGQEVKQSRLVCKPNFIILEVLEGYMYTLCI